MFLRYETTYYQINRETVLNRAKDFYENNKEILRESGNKYKELYEKEKKIKREFGTSRCHMSQKKKQKSKRISKKLLREKKVST